MSHKYKSFLVYIVMITTLFSGGAAYAKAAKSDNQKEQINLKVDFNDSKTKKTLKKVEDFINDLPSNEQITLEDKDLVIKAKQLVKDLRVLDVGLVIKDEAKIEALENQLLYLENHEEETEEAENTEVEKPSEKKDPVATTPSKVRTTYAEEVNYQAIGFDITYVNDGSLNKGTSSVKSDGANGERKIVTKIKYANGSEVSREVISNIVTKNPVNKVILVGTYVAPVQHTGQTGEMINQINASRGNSGIASLVRNGRLDAAAQVRIGEIITDFSHTRPNGQPFYTVDEAMVSGENIAYGSGDAGVNHGRFMNSQGHKDNILRGEYKSVGVAAYKVDGGPTFWVVLFSRY